jgi:hypothetical protein
MQALLIYMLLRLQEGETVQNNFDALLLSTMWVRNMEKLSFVLKVSNAMSR